MEKMIVFDLDGTLYQFEEGTFISSKFYQEIKRKAYKFISELLKISLEQAIIVYQQINEDFNGEISLGLERTYAINRYSYFTNTWNLNPKDFIQKRNLLPLMESLNYEIAFLTSAPKIWATSVLTYLNLFGYLSSLYTGEPDIRKPNILAFQQICDDFSMQPKNCISVGDQVKTDIEPAKKIGMKTVLVGNQHLSADFCIAKIEDLPNLLKMINF